MHGSVPLLLIAAAAGYWVLTLSEKERGRIKKLGQWLGLIIIVVSMAGAACKLYYLTTGQVPPCTAKWGMGSTNCPWPAKSASPPAPQGQ